MKICKEGFITSNKNTVLIVTNMYTSGNIEITIKVKSASVCFEPLHHLIYLFSRNKALILGGPS